MDNLITLPQLQTELKKLQYIVANIPGYEAKADMGMEDCCDMPEVSYSDLNAVYSYISDQVSYLSERISELSNQLWSHSSDGHLPPIEGSEAMARALKALGMTGDYEVQKRVVYADLNSGQPDEMVFSFKPKNVVK